MALRVNQGVATYARCSIALIIVFLLAFISHGKSQFTGQIQHTLCIGVRNTLNCPAGTRFFVLSQTYGWKVTGDGTGCRVEAADYQYVITPEDRHRGIHPLSKCDGKKTCEIKVRNWWQHNHGDSDYLVVTYICDPVKICYLSHPETYSIYYPRHPTPVSLTECCCIDTGYSYSWGRDSPCSNPNVPQEIADDMCPYGFGRKKDAHDIDECAEHPRLCSPGGRCHNQAGSYYCNCDAGWQVNGDWKGCFLPQSSTVCEQYPKICGPGGTCVPTSTGFTCNCRSPGYKTTAYGTCLDVDECHENPHRCSPHGECVNTQGAFRCHCKDGFHQRGNDCIDIDECQLHPTLCDDGKMYGQCVNTPGSYRCSCNQGYRLQMLGGEADSADHHVSPVHYQCTDIDECSETDNICGWATCKNLDGSYRCDCGEGYEIVQHGNGTVCDDVDECSRNPNICGGGNCTNNHGSYMCNCHEGYMHTYSTLHTILKRPVCSDINECEMDTNTCKTDEECVNTEGGFFCRCINDDGDSKDKTNGCGNETNTVISAPKADRNEGSPSGTTLAPAAGTGKAEHSISFVRPVASAPDPNTIMIIAVIIPIVLICLLLLGIFFLYKRRKIFTSPSPGAVFFRLPSRGAASSDYSQNHVNPTYNQARRREEPAVFLPVATTSNNDNRTNAASPSPQPVSTKSSAPPFISSPIVAAAATVAPQRPSSAALQHRQSWSPRRPNYEPPPPPKKVAELGNAEGSNGVTPPVRGTSLARSQSMKETTPPAKELTVAMPPTSNGGGGKLTPTRMAPPEPGYEAVAHFQKTSIDGNDYYVGGQSEHVYEEPIWPATNKSGKTPAKKSIGDQECLKEVEEEEEEEAGAVGGASSSLSAKDARGYNKPVHPGSKHISTEQLDRLCDNFDDDGDDENRNDDDDDDDDTCYSRPLLQGSRARLYDDADGADTDDGGDHNYDEPYVETPHLPTNDAVDKL